MWKTQLLFLCVIVKVSVVLLQFPVLKSFSIRSGNYVLAWISTYTAFLDCSLQDWALSSSVWHLFTFFPADWNVGWLAFNIHAEVAAFYDALRVANVIGLTNVQVITPCVMPCAAVLEYFFFLCVSLNQTFYFFFVPVFSIKQSSRSSEAAEDEKEQRTVTVNPSHMRKAFKVMNELRRYTSGHPLWFSGIMLSKTGSWEMW